MILNAMAVILALTLFGNVVVASASLPIPGSSIGLACLVGYFVLKEGTHEGAARLFDSIAPHISFFFVPAAVGLIAHTDKLAQNWFMYLAAIVFGTSMVIVVTAALAQFLLTSSARRKLS